MAIEDSLSFPIGATDPLAEQIWSQTTHLETLNETFFQMKGLIQQDKDDPDAHERIARAPIVRQDQFGREAGQVLNMRLLRQLTNTPRSDSNTYGNAYLPGNEQAMVYNDVQVWLEKLKNAVGFDTPDLYQTRTSIRMEDDARRVLRSWLRENVEETILDGFYDKHSYIAIQTIASASTTAHPNIVWAEGATSQATMSNTNLMSTRELRRMRAWAIIKKINPVVIDGKDCFIVLMSPNLCNDLLQDTEFQTINASGHHRGHKNPLVSGAIGKFYNLYIHEYNRLRSPTSGANQANIEYVLVIGANALGLGFGSEPRFTVRTEDAYGDRWGRGIRQIIGVGRTDWQNAADSTTLNQSSGQWNIWKTVDEFES